jgi:hypothetical protein
MPRKRPAGVVAALLFLFVACYRFNTLGGALGGFDNDHFLQLTLAKQVEAGERPLRDFLDGVQGAPPALTYELSALAQRVMGDNLRSEAILTVLGVAVGAAVTFVAAASVAPWPVALLTAMLSTFLSPKLYGYPKVLVLGVACLLILRYGRAPTWWRLAALSAWTAVAFLFRHDYAVYCGAGSAIVLALAGPRTWLPRLGRVAAYGALTLVLLAPSLYGVERTEGLVSYLQNGVSMGRRDAARTAIGWPIPSIETSAGLTANLEREENTQAWLYYVFVAIAWLTPIVAAVRLRRGTGADVRDGPMLAVGVMTLLLSFFFLRGSLEARFGDMGPPLAVAAAWLLALSVGGSRRSWSRRAATATVAVAVCAVSAFAIWTLQTVRTELDRAGLRRSPVAVARQAARVWRELGAMPESLRRSDASSPSGRAAAYLHACTAPADRVMVVSYAPEVAGLSGRLFAGGRPTFMPGFFEDERHSRFLMAKLRRESVPIVLAEDEPYYAAYPLLAAYLRDAYVEQGRVEVDGGRMLRVLARRGLSSFPYGAAKLPCFAGASPANGLSQLR